MFTPTPRQDEFGQIGGGEDHRRQAQERERGFHFSDQQVPSE
jgi:hypothetical protein